MTLEEFYNKPSTNQVFITYYYKSCRENGIFTEHIPCIMDCKDYNFWRDEIDKKLLKSEHSIIKIWATFARTYTKEHHLMHIEIKGRDITRENIRKRYINTYIEQNNPNKNFIPEKLIEQVFY